jgi:hypothetical protein
MNTAKTMHDEEPSILFGDHRDDPGDEIHFDHLGNKRTP